MSTNNVHLVRVPPNQNPGAIWARLCAGDKLIREFPITDPNQAESDANTDADLLRPHFAVGHKAFLYLYDGDTGECICTVVALPE